MEGYHLSTWGLIITFIPQLAHAGHDHISSDKFAQIINWIGYLHFIWLHFPIALILLLPFSELLSCGGKHLLFSHTSRFMIVAAAFTAIPASIFGFLLSYHISYEGIMADFFWWHRFLGIWLTLLAIVTAVLNEGFYQKGWKTRKAYFVCLTLLFLGVNVVGFLGGSVTFGIKSFLPLGQLQF